MLDDMILLVARRLYDPRRLYVLDGKTNLYEHSSQNGGRSSQRSMSYKKNGVIMLTHLFLDKQQRQLKEEQ
jgi:hypothetical protein